MKKKRKTTKTTGKNSRSLWSRLRGGKKSTAKKSAKAKRTAQTKKGTAAGRAASKRAAAKKTTTRKNTKRSSALRPDWNFEKSTGTKKPLRLPARKKQPARSGAAAAPSSGGVTTRRARLYSVNYHFKFD